MELGRNSRLLTGTAPAPKVDPQSGSSWNTSMAEMEGSCLVDRLCHHHHDQYHPHQPLHVRSTGPHPLGSSGSRRKESQFRISNERSIPDPALRTPAPRSNRETSPIQRREKSNLRRTENGIRPTRQGQSWVMIPETPSTDSMTSV